MAFRYRIEHHPAASKDFHESVGFFEKIDPDLAGMFRHDLRAALRKLAAGKAVSLLYAAGSTIRWIKLARFSHKVFFDLKDESVCLVLAIISGRRHPDRIRQILSRRFRSDK